MMNLGTEEEKKRNVIQDKKGLWWSSGDVDNIHDRLHELLEEKAVKDSTIVQCSFCAKKVENIKKASLSRKIAIIDTGRDESFVYLIEVEKRRYVSKDTSLDELISGLVSDCKGVDVVLACSDGMSLAAFDIIRQSCELRNLKAHSIPISWKQYEWLFREGQ